MKRFTFTTFLILFWIVTIFAQNPTPTPIPDDENDVVKISTSLVQLDAVVFDNKGNPITDLTAEDFEILQDGKAQKITNFSYISRIIDSAATEQTVKKVDRKNSIPPVSFPPKEIGRVITFVVDDSGCNNTIGGMVAVKEGLENFINDQMLPNDVVAIYQTKEGSSLLQQYTADKAQLLNIVKKIRWLPALGYCGRKYSNAGSEYETVQGPNPAPNIAAPSAPIFGVLRYAIRGLQRLNGRKILFLMSNSFPRWRDEREMKPSESINRDAENITSSQFKAVDDIAELANRASVVINTIDNRGVTNPMLTAEDDPEGIKLSGGEKLTGGFIGQRERFDNIRQSGLAYIANETGGKFYQNMNFLDVPIEKALKTEKGYYLIAYQPDDETFKGKKFHKITLRLKRDDLTVSSRSGFYGIADDEFRPKKRTEDSELYYALTTPIPNADLNIKLSSYFANTPNKGNVIRALLHIDGKDITFLDEPGKTKKVVFDMIAVTLNEKNEVIDDTNRTATVHIPIDRVEEVRRGGLIYSVDVPVKGDGTYTFRTALRDKAAQRLGSSSQIIEIPNLSKNNLLISGLLISGVDGNGNILPTESGESAFSSVVSPAIAAIRKFRQNSVVAYTYTLYNAAPDKVTKLPNLTVQTNLYYEGKLISEGQPQVAEIGKQPDLSRINDIGYLKLNAEVAAGDYVLQVIVKDLTTNQITSQWIDFEVVE